MIMKRVDSYYSDSKSNKLKCYSGISESKVWDVPIPEKYDIDSGNCLQKSWFQRLLVQELA